MDFSINLRKLFEQRTLEQRLTLARVERKLDDLTEQGRKNMSKITDWAAQEQADLTAISSTLDSIAAGITALDALITNFQNSPGTLAPSDQAAMDGIQAASHALVQKSGAIVVTPPAPPAPAT
ncbi:MAG: hypothetical protein ABSD56_00110 [Bryobacteraceae bacterium]|jgi:hypothetical protein